MTHYVYRYYDREGSLLYVGCTQDPWKRYRYHRSDSSLWIGEVARGRISVFATKADALAAEKAAIITEKPPYNFRYRWDYRVDWSQQDYVDYATGFLRTKRDPVLAFRDDHMTVVREVYAALFGQRLPVDPRLVLRQRRAAA